MEVKFRSLNAEDYEKVKTFMKALYMEDTEGKEMTDEKIEKTFAFVRNNPLAGTLQVLELKGQMAGYALIINYWSNEYGGNIIHLDEIYVDNAFRGKGIASSFIKHLIDSKFNNSVAMQIQVMPSNEKAHRLYTALGFSKDKNRFLFYEY